jgi:MOSC domain-containing protein YiiM
MLASGRNNSKILDQRKADMPAIVTTVSRSPGHTFSKSNELMIRLVAGLGVEGDAHMGEKVKHRYQVLKNPNAPNLRQVHLIHEELFDELRAGGFNVQAGAIGENVTTRGLDLLALPKGARLRLGDEAVIEVTGLRNPCRQINAFQSGLTAAVLARGTDGSLIRKAGVMAIVITGGDVKAGDVIAVELPEGERRPLLPV